MVRVGTKNRPASAEEIEQVKGIFVEAINKSKEKTYIVTHHAIDVVEFYHADMPIFRVGSDESPASEDDLKAFEEEVEAAIKEKRPIITHHEVDVIFI
jgi:hypothetical protein